MEKHQTINSNKGIVYCRVSSQEQVKGTSLDGQTKACQDYAESKGIEVVKVFVEKGESATAANRTELINALDFCQKHKGGVVAFIVWKIDRFARNTIDHFALKAQLAKYGVMLHSVTEPISDDPIGKVTETMLAGFAQFENDIRKMRCEGGMKRMLQNGIRPWHPPLGYTHSKNRFDRRKTEPDKQDPERFHLVQRILKEYQRGDVDMTTLAQMANKWGLRTKRDSKITKQNIDVILSEKFYAGIVSNPWTGEEYVGKHEPMITREEFANIQRIKYQRSHNTAVPRIRQNLDFPLRAFVKCVCGHPMSGGWRKGELKRYAYYCCRSNTCEHNQRGIPVEMLNNKFIEELKRITPCKEVLNTLKAVVLDTLENKHKGYEAERLNNEKHLQVLNEKKSRLIQMRINGEISQEEFTKNKCELENKITGIQISTNESRTEELDAETIITFANKFILDIASHWQAITDIHQKQKLQWLVYPKGLTYDKVNNACCTSELSPIFATKKTDFNSQSVLVAGILPDVHSLLGIFREFWEVGMYLRNMGSV